MYNTSNPAELYPNTTWELLPDNKFIKTGSTPLQQAGSNSIKIAKTNLPTDKLQVEAHSMTRGSMDIIGSWSGGCNGYTAPYNTSGVFYKLSSSRANRKADSNGDDNNYLGFKASRNWTGSTSSASPYTSAMGSGTPISINPEHITIKAWKRLS